MKTSLKFFGVMMMSLIFLNCSGSDRIISPSQLPEAATKFIETHFNGVKISYAKIDDGKYEVRLADGTELDFKRSGEWDKVDCKLSPVPGSILALIPAGITAYVESNFPEASIVKIDYERRRIDVELDNDLDLEFNLKGEFLRIDD